MRSIEVLLLTLLTVGCDTGGPDFSLREFGSPQGIHGIAGGDAVAVGTGADRNCHAVRIDSSGNVIWHSFLGQDCVYRATVTTSDLLIVTAETGLFQVTQGVELDTGEIRFRAFHARSGNVMLSQHALADYFAVVVTQGGGVPERLVRLYSYTGDLLWTRLVPLHVVAVMDWGDEILVTGTGVVVLSGRDGRVLQTHSDLQRALIHDDRAFAAPGSGAGRDMFEIHLGSQRTPLDTFLFSAVYNYQGHGLAASFDSSGGHGVNLTPIDGSSALRIRLPWPCNPPRNSETNSSERGFLFCSGPFGTASIDLQQQRCTETLHVGDGLTAASPATPVGSFWATQASGFTLAARATASGSELFGFDESSGSLGFVLRFPSITLFDLELMSDSRFLWALTWDGRFAVLDLETLQTSSPHGVVPEDLTETYRVQMEPCFDDL